MEGGGKNVASTRQSVNPAQMVLLQLQMDERERERENNKKKVGRVIAHFSSQFLIFFLSMEQNYPAKFPND